jgi:hypothetical protein
MMRTSGVRGRAATSSMPVKGVFKDKQPPSTADEGTSPFGRRMICGYCDHRAC